MATKKWRCFFCNEVFTTRQSAWEHFGCESDVPACIDPLRTDEKARMTELREAQKYAMQCEYEAREAEEQADNLAISWEQIGRAFGSDCTSVWQVCDRYKSALNRISDLEAIERASEEEPILIETVNDQLCSCHKGPGCTLNKSGEEATCWISTCCAGN